MKAAGGGDEKKKRKNEKPSQTALAFTRLRIIITVDIYMTYN